MFSILSLVVGVGWALACRYHLWMTPQASLIWYVTNRALEFAPVLINRCHLSSFKEAWNILAAVRRHRWTTGRLRLRDFHWSASSHVYSEIHATLYWSTRGDFCLTFGGLRNLILPLALGPSLGPQWTRWISLLNRTKWWYKVDHLIVSLIYVLVRPSNAVRPPLSVRHPCHLHVEPTALYLQWVGDQHTLPDWWGTAELTIPFSKLSDRSYKIKSSPKFPTV